jgi:hypothetical protein
MLGESAARVRIADLRVATILIALLIDLGRPRSRLIDSRHQQPNKFVLIPLAASTCCSRLFFYFSSSVPWQNRRRVYFYPTKVRTEELKTLLVSFQVWAFYC